MADNNNSSVPLPNTSPPLPTSTTTPAPAAPHVSSVPLQSTIVEQNYLARQVLKAQDRIQEQFPYNASLDAVYWINGAVTICKHTNVRDETAIARILSSELWNSIPIQPSVDQHLQNHHSSNTLCSPTCLTRFCLKDSSVYTKPISVITSALVRYQKPANMDVQEHLMAHLQKEEDLLRRRNPEISHGDIQEQLYGSTLPDGSHLTGTCEDSVVARLIDSLRPTEPYLMEHLNKLELLRNSTSWSLHELINSIRSYERKMHESYYDAPASDANAMVSHYKAKSDLQRTPAVYEYNFYDPTRYTSFLSKPAETISTPPKKPNLNDTLTENLPSQIPAPSLMQSINRLSSVTESLHKMYSDSTPFIHSPSRLPPPSKTIQTTPSPSSRFRTPTHCLRCGSNKHLLWQCTIEDDDRATDLRSENEKTCAFKPSKRYKDRGKSYAHTWALRNTLWPRVWLQPPQPSSSQTQKN